MNLAQNFTPARAVAQHCAELIKSGPRPEERAEHFAIWQEEVARALASDLPDLLGVAKLEVSVSDPEIITGDAVYERLGSTAVNTVLRCGSEQKTGFLSFTIETAIALTDRSFGGTGEPVPDAPPSLPRSAALLLEQASRIIAKAIARASASEADRNGAAGDIVQRSENASMMKPFALNSEFGFFTITIAEPEGVSWEARLVIANELLNGFLPGLANGFPPATPSTPAALDQSALGTVPLALAAMLAEVDLPLAMLERLAPGDTIPLAISRELPLRIGSQVLALGRLGTVEDRMALRLTAVPGGGATLGGAQT